jgi:hypothetical protein
MLHRAPAIEKVQAAIGWTPEYELDTILSDVVEDSGEPSPTRHGRRLRLNAEIRG